MLPYSHFTKTQEVGKKQSEIPGLQRRNLRLIEVKQSRSPSWKDLEIDTSNANSLSLFVTPPCHLAFSYKKLS